MQRSIEIDDVGVSRDNVLQEIGQEIRPGAGFEIGDFVKEELGATVKRLSTAYPHGARNMLSTLSRYIISYIRISINISYIYMYVTFETRMTPIIDNKDEVLLRIPITKKGRKKK